MRKERRTGEANAKLSYKSKKTVINSPDKWAVFEGTHEAIIDKETWEIVQKSREHRRRPTKMGEMGLFSGLAYCADCGAKLYHHRSITLTKEQESYICSNYQSRKREKYQQEHMAELAAFDTAADFLKGLKESGEKITPKAWRAEAAKLTAQKDFDYQKMRDMRDEIKAVENLRKAADRLAHEGQHQQKGTER